MSFDFIAEDVLNVQKTSEDAAIKKALAEYKPRVFRAGNILHLFSSITDNRGNIIPQGRMILRNIVIPHRASNNPVYYIQMSPAEKPEMTFRANMSKEDIYNGFGINLKYDIHRLAFQGQYTKMVNKYLKEMGMPVDNSIDWDKVVNNAADRVLYSSTFKNDEGEKTGMVIDALLDMLVEHKNTFDYYDPSTNKFAGYFYTILCQKLRNKLLQYTREKKRNRQVTNDSSDFTNEEQMDYMQNLNNGSQTNVEMAEDDDFVTQTKNQIEEYFEDDPKWQTKFKPIWDMLREGKSIVDISKELSIAKMTIFDRYRKLLEMLKECAEFYDNDMLYKIVEMHQNPKYNRILDKDREESETLSKERDKTMNYIKQKNEEYYKKYSSRHEAESEQELHNFMVDLVQYFEAGKGHTSAKGNSIFREILTDVFGKDAVDAGEKLVDMFVPEKKDKHEAAIRITKKTLNNFLSESKLVEASFNSRQTMEDMEKTESEMYTALLDECEDIIEEGTSIYGLKATREDENVPEEGKKASLKDIYGCEEFENELQNPYI